MSLVGATSRRLFLASLLRHRLATALSLLAIALGVALGLAVQLIHGAAIDEFGRGLRTLAGEADLQLVGPREGFDEAIYPMLAKRPEIAEASPVLRIEARLPGREDTLEILGVDMFRVARMQALLRPRADPALMDGDGRLAGLQPRNIFVSVDARARLELPSRLGNGEMAGPALRDGVLTVQSGVSGIELRLAGELPLSGAELAVMDIGGAQQMFGRIGVLSRIDLKLAPGLSPEAAGLALSPLLPPGLALQVPEAAAGEASALSRAYRVNLTMLAAIAPLTGAFLVFSTQVLSVARRRREFALLRALGMERRQLLRGLLAEGAVLGLVGGVIGVALGHALAALAFRLVGGDLGAGFFRGSRPGLQFDAMLAAGYLLLGGVAGVLGSWLPARAASQVAPARALRAGEAQYAGLPHMQGRLPLALLLAAGAGLACMLPPAGGIPLGGYAAVALSLMAAVLSLPALAQSLLPLLGRTRSVIWRLAHARLSATPGQAVVAAAGVVASVALASAMAIMVSSFRVSVDDWLAQVLPADLYVRASSSAASGYLDDDALVRIAAVPGVASVDTTRLLNLRLSDEEPVFSLLARPVDGNWGLPLVAGSTGRPDGSKPGQSSLPPAWISEAAVDRLGLGVGDRLTLPLAGRQQSFVVAGVWRDYSRQYGAALIEPADYRALTGDDRVNDAAIRLEEGTDAGAVADALNARFGPGRLIIALPGEIRATTLQIFDRTFLITYLMEAVTVMIGLFGIATTFAALAGTREGEFGMLRHLGFTRGEIGRLIAAEGALTAGFGVACGLLAGGAMAWILIEVVNRQSFHWSMDLAVPWAALVLFAAVLVSLAALVARLAGARAMRGSAVQAVKADW